MKSQGLGKVFLLPKCFIVISFREIILFEVIRTPLSLNQSSLGSNNLNTRSHVRLKAERSMPCLHQIQMSARGKTVPFTCLFWLQSESSCLSGMWQPGEANGKKAIQKCGFGSVCCGCTTPDPPTKPCAQPSWLLVLLSFSSPDHPHSAPTSPVMPWPFALLPWFDFFFQLVSLKSCFDRSSSSLIWRVFCDEKIMSWIPS